ncbi:ABC transporter permease subunit [Nostoc sp. NMS4]|uniref:ABC transporter permease subunit n=1 Tax=Nostoc sp. NMS4 TaxID=2815390 RepID=UPI0025F85ED3|nr:ABC transporter permease subunit [Nostoc sp. NMS4]MBN3927762.1 ABC transporter permease subunit [Nostoc sp. NMS4]
MLNLIDKIGDWNPQLLRELKGRLKFFNVAIAVAISLLLQWIVFSYQLQEFPDDNWWLEHWEHTFVTVSVIFIFTLLLGGTYLLINDLAKEETRGTLNFLRLSPQSETTILTGKLLGVPSLIYLIVLVAVPLHLWAGFSAQIAFSYILSFYAILAANCIFFYSAALLFGLLSRWFSGFQPWLGSGAVFLSLFITMVLASSDSNSLNNATVWFRLLNPWDATNYLFPNLFHVYNGSPLINWQFFYLPLGTNVIIVVGFHLLNFGLCSYGIWQAIKRCFRNPQASIISKKQSYLLVAFCQLMMWGFTLQISINNSRWDEQIWENLLLLAVYNLVLILSLIAVLSPHRQDVQDWARYRHQGVSNHKSIWQDLIWAEKSPALVAIAINLTIVTIPWLVWISFTSVFDANDGQTWLSNDLGRLKVLLAIALSISLMMIYTTIAQFILLLKTPKRSFWAIGTLSGATFLPPMILEFIGISSSNHPNVWLFSTFPWAAIQYSEVTTIFMALLADLSVLVLLNFQLRKRVRLVGESATKALLAGR